MTSRRMYTTKSTSWALDAIAALGALGVFATVALLPAGAAPMHSAYAVNTTSGMTLAGPPLAIHGYDPVAYFSEGRARVGKAAFTAKHHEAAYRFASAANKTRFEKNPEHYVPRYGGYCAFGVSVGAKFDGDPNLFRIVDDKLHLNLNPEIQATWAKDIPRNVAKADRSWPGIQGKAPWELK